MLIVLVGAGAWALQDRPASESRRPLPPNANAAHYAILGRAVLDMGRSAKANKEALGLFDKALAIDPNCIPALIGYASVMVTDVVEGWVPRHERSVRLDQAEVAVERAITLDARNPRAHYYRGVLLRARGDPDGAMAALQHTLALSPSYAMAYAQLGRVKI